MYHKLPKLITCCYYWINYSMAIKLVVLLLILLKKKKKQLAVLKYSGSKIHSVVWRLLEVSAEPVKVEHEHTLF